MGRVQHNGLVELFLWCCLGAFGFGLHGAALPGCTKRGLRGITYVSIFFNLGYVAIVFACGVGRLIGYADQKLSVVACRDYCDA